MSISKQEEVKAGTRTGLKHEFTPPKIVAGLGMSLLATLVTWLGGQTIQKISFREYLWPEGVVVFLSMLAALFIFDNVRLRRRVSKGAKGAVAPIEVAPVEVVPVKDVAHRVNALELSDVLGRDDEIRQMIDFIMSDERKFLCLQGPGGVGKTTVARAALSRLDNVRPVFVEVDAIEERDRDPLAVDQAFAVAVATQVQGLGVPLVNPESPREAVANALRQLRTRTVIVIDNVEQMVNRAALIIPGWVQENPLARVLVTSRVELNVGTEKVLEIRPFQTHPLELAPADMLKDPGPALKLFERRRSNRHANFKLNEDNVAAVNRICDAVGGLPLGIELAAPVERTLAEIEAGIKERSDYLESLRPDLPKRHRSLAATIDWSLRLLDRDSHSLLLQLSVAPAELDDEAINCIVWFPDSLRQMHVLLSVLVSANLLVRSERTGRSTYREPIEVRRRCTDLRRTKPHEAESSAWPRFAATFAARAGAAYKKRYGSAVRQALDAVERDYDNLLAVAQRVELTDPTVAASVAVCLNWMVSIRRPSEPRLETLETLAASVPGSQQAVLSQLQTALSATCLDLCIRTGEQLEDEAVAWAERAVKTGETSGDHTVIGEAQQALALVMIRRGESDQAIRALDAAAQHFTAAREFAAAAIINATWASVPPREDHKDKLIEAKRLLGTGDSPLARYAIRHAEFSLWQHSQTMTQTDMRRLTSELLGLAKEIKSTSMELRALHVISLFESELDNQDRAFEAMKERAALLRTAGSPVQQVGLMMNDMAAVLLRRWPVADENLDEAIRLLDEALLLVKDGGLERDVAILRGNRAWALFHRGRVQEAVADSTAAIISFEEMREWEAPNAFIQATMHAQILDGAGDVSGGAKWADIARQLADQHDFSEASVSPEVRRRARWLTGYLAVVTDNKPT